MASFPGAKDRVPKYLENTAAQARRSARLVRSAGSSRFEKASPLQHLVPFSADEINDESADAIKKLIAGIRAALRRERRNGRAGHWTYDLNRHIALYQALSYQLRRLNLLSRES